mgnify:CR=1 FL=1
MLSNSIKQMAKKIDATIILPEANLDNRIYQAAKTVLKKKIAKLIVFGNASEFDETFKSNDCQIIDINTYPKEMFVEQLFELRKSKGITKPQAEEMLKNPLYFAMMLLVDNKADACVAGAHFSTADVLLPALQIVKTKPNKSFVTGSMILTKKGKKPLVFGDVSLIENPDQNKLAEIAISNAEFMQKVLGQQPKVAMLSYSTHGSAKSEMVDKVKNATALAKEKSEYLIDGEMQVDSALDIETAKHKGITSEVGGQANVLIFPDLNAGNIGYKLVARLGGYQAIGPIMLNFKKPVTDLSRGANVNEILDTIIITKLLTQC